MSKTVYEALQNAQINFETFGSMGMGSNPFFVMAKEQLDNALEALKNGNNLDSIIQENMMSDVDTSKP